MGRPDEELLSKGKETCTDMDKSYTDASKMSLYIEVLWSLCLDA